MGFGDCSKCMFSVRPRTPICHHKKDLHERGTDDLDDPGTSGNDRQSLPKVTCKHGGDTTEERNIINILNDIFQKVFEGTFDCFWTMTVLHRSFIPYDELCVLEDAIHIAILSDPASGRLIDGDGNFEARMCSSATMEKGNNCRRGNTKNDIAFCMNSSSKGIADVSLSTTSGTVKEKEFSFSIVNRIPDLESSGLTPAEEEACQDSQRGTFQPL